MFHYAGIFYLHVEAHNLIFLNLINCYKDTEWWLANHVICWIIEKMPIIHCMSQWSVNNQLNWHILTALASYIRLSYSTALRQCCTYSFSIYQVSFCVNQITCGSLCGLQHSHAQRSMVVPFWHRALKHSNWHRLYRKLLEWFEQWNVSEQVWENACKSDVVWAVPYYPKD